MTSAKSTTAQVLYDDKKTHESVKVAGEFNSWDPLALSNSPPSTKYSVTVKDLVPGHTYMYKFIIDGEWILASDGRPITDDNCGNINHSLVAPALEDQTDVANPNVADKEKITTSPETQSFSKPTINTDEEEPVVKETVFDTEEEAEAPISAAVKNDKPDSTPPAPSAAVLAKSDSVTPQPRESKLIKESRPEKTDESSEQALPVADTEAIAPVAAAIDPVSAVPQNKHTTGEEALKAVEAAQPISKVKEPVTEDAETDKPAKSVKQPTSTTDISTTAASIVPEFDLVPTVVADSGASAVANFSNVAVGQPPITTQETITSQSIAPATTTTTTGTITTATSELASSKSRDRSSSLGSSSVKSRPSADTSTGKDIDTPHHDQLDHKNEPASTNTFSDATAAATDVEPTNVTASNPAAAAANATTAAGTTTNSAGGVGNGGDDSGTTTAGNDANNQPKRSWISRFFGFFARLFK